MSKKHYQQIAAAFYTVSKETGRGVEDETWQLLRKELAYVMASENSRFCRDRFYEACETGKTRGMKQVAA